MFLIILFGLKFDNKDFSYSNQQRTKKGSPKNHFLDQFILLFFWGGFFPPKKSVVHFASSVSCFKFNFSTIDHVSSGSICIPLTMTPKRLSYTNCRAVSKRFL